MSRKYSVLYIMRSLILQVFFISSSLAVYVHEECEARSEWELRYTWTDINLSVWVPPSEKSKFLSVDIEFEGHIIPIVYDSMALSRDTVYLDRVRSGTLNSTEYKMPEPIAEGWADFKITLNSHYGMMYLSNNAILPVSSSVEYIPKLITLKGSNITLNCLSRQKMWKISNNPVYVPFNSKQHRFTLFSTREFLPLFSVEMREFSVAWDKGLLTTIPSGFEPLPPFEEHTITITCQRAVKYKCIIQLGENATVAEEFTVGKDPQSILIKSESGTAFILILNNDGNSTSQPSCHEPCSWLRVFNLVAVSLGILLLAAFLLICLIKWKTKYV